VREYLAALDDAEIEKSIPKNISLTDPAAQWSAAGGSAFYAYSINYLVDMDAGIVMDVEATPAHKLDEIKATKTMISRVEERFALKPDRLIGDTKYGTAELLGRMVNEKNIEPHVSVWDRTQRDDDTLSSSEFRWDEQANEYRCPAPSKGPIRASLPSPRRPRGSMSSHSTSILEIASWIGR
jgi:hypothetical protein